MTKPPASSLPTATLDWDAGDAVRSASFGDVYYSDLGGLEEARHVFLDGNDLPARFAALADTHPSTLFTVAELGFGTGLNILALWQAWAARGHDRGRLHVFSVEGFPLSQQDFTEAQSRIAERWPDLADIASRLAALYPSLIPGLHTLRLAPDLTLTIALGEVGEMLAQAALSADAWFLDGFSPALNEAIWREEVMAEIPRLSAAGATAATFTVAGAVRRRLQANGFALEKRPGFGRKREMLTARLETRPAQQDDPAPWFSTAALRHPPADEAIIIEGAGIAGASLAWHLTRAGRTVRIYDPAGPASGASGNPAGLIMPRLDLGQTPARGFYAHAFLYTVSLIEELERQTGDAIFVSRGGLMLALNEEESDRHRRLAESGILPAEEMRLVSSEEAAGIAGIGLTLPPGDAHLYLPRAGTILPQAFVKALLGPVGVIETRPPDTAGPWIHASGPATAQHMMPGALAASAGQVDIIDIPGPHCAVTFGNYIAPLGDRLITGATYDPASGNAVPGPSEENTRRNIAAASDIMPGLSGMKAAASRAALRCVTADRHPVAGPLPDAAWFAQAYAGLSTGDRTPCPPAQYVPDRYILSGLGSRGLVTAPFLAEMLCALITGAPAPAGNAEQNMVHPARFIVRALKKKKPV